MKKLLSFVVAAIMLAASFSAAYSANDITVTLDGTKLEFDVQPQIINDRTMVPMRAIFEALGATVEWDGATQSIISEKDGKEIIMNIGYELMFVNYSPITLDTPPQIIDGRTLVPVRAIAESFECEVGWDGDTETVTITSTSAEPEETPEPAHEPEEFPIKYDNSVEFTSSLAKNFVLTSVTHIDGGKYEITYTLDAYRESSGDVIVSYDCLDESGRRVDGFSKLFFAYAYCWTPQEGSAVISDRTATIVLSEE